jgi:hypothetical protein
MEITGQQIIQAPQETVWRALNDPAILAQCIPGCESIEQATDSEYRVVMTATVGPVKAKFKGRLVLSELQPPTSYTITFDGSGGSAGFAKGSARVELAPQDGATRLDYRAEASIGGKLAQFGSRLIEGVAATMSEKFFTAFNQAVAPQAAAEPVTAGGGVRWWWIALGAVLAILVLLYLFGAFG